MNAISLHVYAKPKRFSLIIFLLISTIATQAFGNQSIDEISSYHNIILVENIETNNSNENLVVDILKGKLDVHTFNLLKETSGFASENKAGGLFLFYTKINENGRLGFGAVRIMGDHTITRRGLNKFHLLELYQHLRLSEQNHTFPKFLDVGKPTK